MWAFCAHHYHERRELKMFCPYLLDQKRCNKTFSRKSSPGKIIFIKPIRNAISRDIKKKYLAGSNVTFPKKEAFSPEKRNIFYKML